MNRSTVLVIDDDGEFRDAVLLMLESKGFHAVGAESGLNALGLAATERPAVILCDLLMPAMNGIDVVMELRKSEAMRQTPIVLMSGLCGMDRAAGLPVLSKPFTADELVSALDQAGSANTLTK